MIRVKMLFSFDKRDITQFLNIEHCMCELAKRKALSSPVWPTEIAYTRVPSNDLNSGHRDE